MARVAATASVGVKVALKGVEGFTQYDNVSPHHSITIERQVSDDLTDEQLVEAANELHKKAEALVTKKINKELTGLGKPEK